MAAIFEAPTVEQLTVSILPGGCLLLILVVYTVFSQQKTPLKTNIEQI